MTGYRVAGGTVESACVGLRGRFGLIGVYEIGDKRAGLLRSVAVETAGSAARSVTGQTRTNNYTPRVVRNSIRRDRMFHKTYNYLVCSLSLWSLYLLWCSLSLCSYGRGGRVEVKVG